MDARRKASEAHQLRGPKTRTPQTLVASDYLWTGILQHVASVLWQRQSPVPFDKISDELHYRHDRPGDFMRAAYQIDSRQDEAAGARYLTQWALMKLRRFVQETPDGFVWRGPQHLTIDRHQIDLYSDKYRDEQRAHALATRWADPRQNDRDPFESDWLTSMQAERLSAKDDGLRTSLQAHGYLADFPIIRDKATGHILSGHRRMKLCNELGIAPVIVDRDFPPGREGRIQKMRLFIAANDGVNGWSAPQRRIMMRELEMDGWTADAISAAFQVSLRTVRRDTKPGRDGDKQDRDQRIRALAADGYSQREIVDLTDVPRTTVQRVINESPVAHSGHDGQNGPPPGGSAEPPQPIAWTPSQPARVGKAKPRADESPEWRARVFSLFAEGKTYEEIAAMLDAEGYGQQSVQPVKVAHAVWDTFQNMKCPHCGKRLHP